jgi:hypothetical protein
VLGKSAGVCCCNLPLLAYSLRKYFISSDLE